MKNFIDFLKAAGITLLIFAITGGTIWIASIYTKEFLLGILAILVISVFSAVLEGVRRD